MSEKKTQNKIMAPWLYTEEVKSHFFKPRNAMIEDPAEGEYDAVGISGSPACGDYIKVWLKIDPKTQKIKDMKWQSFGCASAIACASVLSVMVTENGGMHIDEAAKVKPRDIMHRLVKLPPQKVHCSILGDKALQVAIADYKGE